MNLSISQSISQSVMTNDIGGFYVIYKTNAQCLNDANGIKNHEKRFKTFHVLLIVSYQTE